MTTLYALLIVAVINPVVSAQMTSNAPIMTQTTIIGENAPRYRLFPTENNWTFLKLDTRSGVIWHLQYTIDEPELEGDYVIVDMFEVYPKDDEEYYSVNGRYTLQATSNTYTFLLLDQIDGRVWHIQWSTDSDAPEGIMSRID